MSKKLFVGNLDFGTTEEDIRGLFSSYGDIEEVFLPTDKFSGRPRGFAFVTLADDDRALAAVDELHGQEFGGRELAINEARPREERRPAYNGGGGGGRRSGGFNNNNNRGGGRSGRGRRSEGRDSY